MNFSSCRVIKSVLNEVSDLCVCVSFERHSSRCCHLSPTLPEGRTGGCRPHPRGDLQKARRYLFLPASTLRTREDQRRKLQNHHFPSFGCAPSQDPARSSDGATDWPGLGAEVAFGFLVLLPRSYNVSMLSELFIVAKRPACLKCRERTQIRAHSPLCFE